MASSKKIFLNLLVFGIVAVAFYFYQHSFYQTKKSPLSPRAGTEEAPAFPDELEWVNIPNPLKLEDLKGHWVILAFINRNCPLCPEIFKDIRALKAKYGEKIKIIAIHSPAKKEEKNTEVILDDLIKFNINDPIVNDNKLKFLKLYGVKAWPTLFLIDDKGMMTAGIKGGKVFETFSPIIEELSKKNKTLPEN